MHGLPTTHEIATLALDREGFARLVHALPVPPIDRDNDPLLLLQILSRLQDPGLSIQDARVFGVTASDPLRPRRFFVKVVACWSGLYWSNGRLSWVDATELEDEIRAHGTGEPDEHLTHVEFRPSPSSTRALHHHHPNLTPLVSRYLGEFVATAQNLALSATLPVALFHREEERL